MRSRPAAAIAEALAVTAEVCGTDLSEAAVRVMLADLSEHPQAAVLAALGRVRREHKGRLSLAAILERVDDGRPGVEEAWALVPKDERDTAVMTREMQRALYAVQGLINDGDEIAARMAFKETYSREVAQAKARGDAVEWQASVGWDATGRVAPLAAAVEKGRIPVEIALQYVHGERAVDLLQLAGIKNHPMLGAPPSNDHVRALTSGVAAKGQEATRAT